MTRLFDLDFQLLADAFLMMIAIFALFLVASYFLFNPVREMLEKRKDKIAGELSQAASDKEQAAALKAEYEAAWFNQKQYNVDFIKQYMIDNNLVFTP